MNDPEEDKAQQEYLRAWKRRKGCFHWLLALAFAAVWLATVVM